MEPSKPHHSLSGSSILNRLIDIDTELSLFIHTKCQSFPRSILKALEFSGDGRFWFPIPIALWLTPLSGNPHLNSILVHLFLGFFLDLFFVGLLKYTIRRPRPVYNKGMHLTVSVDHWSFPSGHSSRACFVGSFLWVSSELIKDGFASLELEGVSGSTKFMLRWFDLEGDLVQFLLLYVVFWSVATSVSRILLGRHFVFDVVAGAVLGLFEAFIMFYALQYRNCC